MRIAPTAATLAMLVLAGCSSPQPAPREPGTLANGTARFTVNDAAAGSTQNVACTTAGSLVTITTGDDQSGVTALVDTDGDITAQSVTIRNVGGFTGSYNAGLGGESKVLVKGRTYDISGSADGFATDNPSFRIPGTFNVKVAC